MKLFFFFPAILLLFSSCDPASNESGCQDDSDCRFGRQCVRNVCIGKVDFQPSNNGTTPNNGQYYTNNGSDTNNGYYGTNNGYYGSNNGYYTNNGINNGFYTNNSTADFCRFGDDCDESQACSQGRCESADDAKLFESSESRESCFYSWGIMGENTVFAEVACKLESDNNYICTCTVQSETSIVQKEYGAIDPCGNPALIEQDINDFCGTKIRGTF